MCFFFRLALWQLYIHIGLHRFIQKQRMEKKKNWSTQNISVWLQTDLDLYI